MYIAPNSWYCLPLRTATRFRTALHILYKKKKKKDPGTPSAVQTPNAAGPAAAPGRALFAVGSGAGDGRAPLGSALVALLMARCFHVADGWGLAGRIRDHDGSVSRSREWWVAPGCSGRAGGGSGFVVCLWFFGARSSVWVTLLQIAWAGAARLGGEQPHCSVIWATETPGVADNLGSFTGLRNVWVVVRTLPDLKQRIC